MRVTIFSEQIFQASFPTEISALAVRHSRRREQEVEKASIMKQMCRLAVMIQPVFIGSKKAWAEYIL